MGTVNMLKGAHTLDSHRGPNEVGLKGAPGWKNARPALRSVCDSASIELARPVATVGGRRPTP